MPVLDINPAVRDDIAHRFQSCFVFQVDFGHKNPQGHIIPIGKPRGNPGRVSGNIIHSPYQVFDRHGRDEVVSLHRVLFSVPDISKTGEDIILVFVKSGHAGILDNGSAQLLNLGGSHVPELAGA